MKSLAALQLVGENVLLRIICHRSALLISSRKPPEHAKSISDPVVSLLRVRLLITIAATRLKD